MSKSHTSPEKYNLEGMLIDYLKKKVKKNSVRPLMCVVSYQKELLTVMRMRYFPYQMLLANCTVRMYIRTYNLPGEWDK